jgi:hypothetical protein
VLVVVLIALLVFLRTYCTYFEFSDDPKIFARLCFSSSSGELVEKRKHDVFKPLRSATPQGQAV